MNDKQELTSRMAEVVDHDPFAGGELAVVPTGAAQQEIWASAQVCADASCAFNQSLALRLVGTLDLPTLQRAFDAVVASHDVLRSTVSTDGASMYVAESIDVTLPVTDLRTATNAAVELESLVSAEVSTPFDLVRGPLVRGRIVQLDGNEHVMLLTAHHVICDGRSANQLLRELGSRYTALRRTPVAVRKLSGQMGANPHWSADGARSLRYWCEQYKDGVPVVNFPGDGDRPRLRTYRASRTDTPLDMSVWDRLHTLGRRVGATPFITALASYTAWLHRVTGLDDLVIGVPVTFGPAVDHPERIGHFVNVLPIRSTVRSDQSFREYLEVMRDVVLEAYDHRDVSFGELIPQLRLERDASRVPLVPVVFTMDDDIDGLVFDGLEATAWWNPRRHETFEIYVRFVRRAEGVMIETTHNLDLITPPLMHERVRGLLAFLGDAAERPDAAIRDLAVMSPAQRQWLLRDLNAAVLPVPHHGVHELVESQVRKTPGAVAVVDGDRDVTYAELNDRANQLANYLRSLGVGPEKLVGVCVERSVDLLVAVLGVLKAGGAYVPLDPAYPAERIAFIVEDAAATVIISESRLTDRLPETRSRIVMLDSELEAISDAGAESPPWAGTQSDLAYVIYTSGSTGKPKGVAIEHRSTVAMLAWAQTVYDAYELSGVLASTSICFDLSVFEIFLPLISGGSVILAQDALALPGLPAAGRVTLVNTVPSAMAELLQLRGLPPSVKTVNLAGERLTVELVRQIYTTGTVERVYDLYGPSEDTTYSTWTLRHSDGPYTIGRPIPNSQVHILDPDGQLVPVGVTGEIYLGGMGLAREYLGRPDLTAERFVSNPFHDDPTARLYRTGDLARWRLDGTLDFLGRADNQVKVRGFRIELGEIETALLRHPQLHSAAVVAHWDEAGDARLVAYVVARGDETLTVSEVRRFLRRKLPDYMIPGLVLTIDEIPRLPNGKVDRRSLPQPFESVEPIGQFEAPETDGERLVARVWEDLLQVGPVGRTDNFFERGGHSILAIRASRKIEELSGKTVDPRIMFFQTLKQIAIHLVGLAGHISSSS